MLRRMPHLIMGVLTLLSVGAVILGLAEAPRTPDLQVHNAFALTLATTRFVAKVTQVDTTPGKSPQVQTIRVSYVKPDTVIATAPNGQTKRYTGAAEKTFLAGFATLEPLNGWIAHGSTYALTGLPAADALVTSARGVTGTSSETIVVSGKYVASLHEHVSYTYQGVHRLFDGYLRFVSIDGTPVSG